jgi:ABC-type lipoprotein release transport system permease subunit
LEIKDAAVVLLVAVFLSFISALYPAIVAGRLDPAKALRYE